MTHLSHFVLTQLGVYSVFLLAIGVFLSLLAPYIVAQSNPQSAPHQFFLLPTTRTTIVLQTQTADIRLTQRAGSVFTSFDGLYRVRNSGNAVVTLNLRVAAYSSTGASDVALPADLSVTANGAPLAIVQGPEGTTVQVEAAPNGRIDLRLRYSMDLGVQPVVEVIYPVSVLKVWPGSVSQRTTIVLPESMPQGSWLTLQPDDWTYASSLPAGETGIQWLFEGRLSETPLLLRAFHPVAWQQIVAAQSAVKYAPTSQAWVQLGDLYAQILAASREGATRDRFYEQALAAYSDALHSGGAPAELALAYSGQAALYRERLLDSAGVVNPRYAQLLVDAAARALVILPPDHPRRSELARWLDSGVSIALADARNRRDWQAALGTLDLLSSLPAGLVDSQMVGDERRRIAVEQSLQLLEEGQRDAAVAISGGGIVDESLRPPLENLALFAAWQVTATLAPGGVTIHFVATPAPGVEEAAKTSLEELAGLLHEAAAAQGGSVTLRPALEMHVTLPRGVVGLALANATLLNPNWALVRALLAQTAPVVEQESRLLQRIYRMSQSLDLRNVGDQWRRIADRLEEQAQTFQSQSNPSERSDPSALEGALRARVQAANYRATATNWRNLAQNSRVIARLVGPGSDSAPGRAWQLSVDDPSQTLRFESQTINWVGVWMLIGLALIVLLLLTGLLWSLL